MVNGGGKAPKGGERGEKGKKKKEKKKKEKKKRKGRDSVLLGTLVSSSISSSKLTPPAVYLEASRNGVEPGRAEEGGSVKGLFVEIEN